MGKEHDSQNQVNEVTRHTAHTDTRYLHTHIHVIEFLMRKSLLHSDHTTNHETQTTETHVLCSLPHSFYTNSTPVPALEFFKVSIFKTTKTDMKETIKTDFFTQI